MNLRPMKLRKNTILLFVTACAAWICGGRAFAAGSGLVIYKDYSFDPDSQAEVMDYTSVERYPSVDNVLTPNGQTLQITPAQEPIYIPHAGDPQTSGTAVTGTILAAERRFPQFAGKLEAYRQAWAAVPIATPAPRPSPAIAAAPQATPQEDAAPAGGSARVLLMKNGEKLTDWKVSAVEGDSVVITHADGISRIPITDLPDNLFGFPPEVTARAEQLRQQAAERARTGTAQGTPSGVMPPSGAVGAARTGVKGPGKPNHHRTRPAPDSLDWD